MLGRLSDPFPGSREADLAGFLNVLPIGASWLPLQMGVTTLQSFQEENPIVPRRTMGPGSTAKAVQQELTWSSPMCSSHLAQHPATPSQLQCIMGLAGPRGADCGRKLTFPSTQKSSQRSKHMYMVCVYNYVCIIRHTHISAYTHNTQHRNLSLI